MTITKNGKDYVVKENVTSWTLSTSIGRVAVSYNVKKADCPTFDALKAFVDNDNAF